MGGRFGPLRNLKLGPGYTIVKRLKTKHRYAYYDEGRRRLVVTRADGSDKVELATDDVEFEWAPDGQSLFAAREQVVRIAANTGLVSSLTSLASKREPSSLSPSLDGRRLAFNVTTVEPDRVIDETGLADRGVRSTALALLDLETGKTVERHGGRDVLDINVCWSSKRAAISLARPTPRQDLSIVDLNTGALIRTVPWMSPWRQFDKEQCQSESCTWHCHRILSRPEMDAISPAPNWPAVSVHGSRVVFLRNDAELRIAERMALERGSLIMEARGPQSTFENRNDLRGHVRFSPDGRLIRGSIARWTRRSKLTQADADTVGELLELAGLVPGARPAELIERATPDFTERLRYSERTYDFIADVDSKEIQFTKNRHDLKFSPRLFA